LVDVEQWAELRREHLVRGVSIKELVRRTGLSRNTVRATLRSSRPPGYERGPAGSKLDPFKGEIRVLLKRDPALPGQRIRELIEPLGFDTAPAPETSALTVALLMPAMDDDRAPRPASCPLPHRPEERESARPRRRRSQLVRGGRAGSERGRACLRLNAVDERAQSRGRVRLAAVAAAVPEPAATELGN